MERDREEVVKQREEQWEKDKETVNNHRTDKSDVQSRHKEVQR